MTSETTGESGPSGAGSGGTPGVPGGVDRELPAAPPVAADILGERLPAMEHYVAILATRGVDHGLVGPREVPRLWERHILNCAVIGDLIDDGAIVADVGTGAGLPGLVLAVARPDLHVHLIEPLQRRVTWLDGAVAELGLSNVTIHRGKAQAFWGEVEADVVTSRAVARIGELVAWCLPLLRAGGEIVAIKGASAGAEVEQDRAGMARAGMETVEVQVVGEFVVEVPTTVVRVRGIARTGGRRPRSERGDHARRGGSRRGGGRGSGPRGNPSAPAPRASRAGTGDSADSADGPGAGRHRDRS